MYSFIKVSVLFCIPIRKGTEEGPLDGVSNVQYCDMVIERSNSKCLSD